MGLLARAIERKASSSLELWAEIAKAGRMSKAGATINLTNALRVATWFACVNVLARGTAQVPFKLFQETQDGGLTKILPARQHRLYDLLTTKPNDWQTSYEFREQLVIHAAHGNAYAWKNVVGGKVLELILLDPSRMAPEQPDEFGEPRYKYTLRDGRVVPFRKDQIWHVRGPSWTGFAGLDILQQAREALGLAIATEETHSGLHANGVKTTGVYSVEGTLNADQNEKLRAALKKEARENPGAPLILDRSAKWLATTMSGMDAQHLETRRFQIEEVCRFAGVSPFMVFHTDKAPTYASAEQFQIQHVVHTLAPWYARIEQSADANLLTDKERAQGLYFKFVAAGLLRGSMKDQGEFFAKLLGSGGTRQVATVDEIRALLEMNPMGGDAAILHAPTGSAPPAEAGKETP